MNRFLSIIIFCSFSLFYSPLKAFCGNLQNQFMWTAADILESTPGFGCLRFGKTGNGAFPYSYSTSSPDVTVYFENIPQRYYSPFGADLERIPLIFTGNMDMENNRTLYITLPDTIPSVPLTGAEFSSGEKRRFNFQTRIYNSLSEKSAFFLGGASSGIHGDEEIMGNSARTYILKYFRDYKDNGVLKFVAAGSRDRDDIFDIRGEKYMGERETDDMSFSIGMDNCKIGEYTAISSGVYYSADKSRYSRYGAKGNIDDNLAGASLKLISKKGIGVYSAEIRNDLNYFDSELHDKSWSRNLASGKASYVCTSEKVASEFSAEIDNSSRYGGGYRLNGSLDFPVKKSLSFVLTGESAEKLPNPGLELYPSVSFGDSALVSDIGSVKSNRFETGFRYKKEKLSLGVYGYAVSGKDFVFDYENPQVFTGDYRNTGGIRITGALDDSASYRIDTDMSFSGMSDDSGEPSKTLFPYPQMNIKSSASITRRYFNNHLEPSFYGRMQILGWKDAGTGPKGVYAFFDTGLMIKVESFIIFYNVENITGETFKFFDVSGWLGRSSYWGVRWTFLN